jgi:hypothetical protein
LRELNPTFQAAGGQRAPEVKCGFVAKSRERRAKMWKTVLESLAVAISHWAGNCDFIRSEMAPDA